MTKKAILIFPHQLFENNPALINEAEIFLVEEYLFFRQYNFHKQKLLFHRASMNFYSDYVSRKGYQVNYIESSSELSDIRSLIQFIHKSGFTEIHYADVVDNWLENRIKSSAQKFGLKVYEYESQCFINSKEEIINYFKGKRKYSQTEFYIKQRRKLNLLIDENGKPVGGKWTFDSENRAKLSNTQSIPEITLSPFNKYYKEAVDYVEKNFPFNPGKINLEFLMPITFVESKLWLDKFLQQRFMEFGKYQDAIIENESTLNHSLLSPMMNIGLITPDYIMKATMNFIDENKVPLNSAEGFIRQIIGWREFIRGVYITAGTYQRRNNFWKFNRQIPKSFWNATTGIKPIDNTIEKVLKTGYAHHIERLMIIGNFMLLCQFAPNEVYQWFMELFIDAYDWVMVPNVYGMSQFADGGLMSTKPYISGSNYLLKMSNYKKDSWTKVWDSLFWNFMASHRNFFSSNPRLSLLLKTYDKMDNRKKSEIKLEAERFLKSI